MKISMFQKTGSFAGNKDVARDIRVNEIMPTLEKNQEVIIDFSQVDGATQSFIHALISDAMREFGVEVLGKIIFRSCNQTVQNIINIVTEYMQAGLEQEDDVDKPEEKL